MLTERIVGALTFRRGVYAAVEADKSFTPAHDPAILVMVHFIFDRTPACVVVMDDIGFRD